MFGAAPWSHGALGEPPFVRPLFKVKANIRFSHSTHEKKNLRELHAEFVIQILEIQFYYNLGDSLKYITHLSIGSSKSLYAVFGKIV